jgi:hypothetical protein
MEGVIAHAHIPLPIGEIPFGFANEFKIFIHTCFFIDYF